MLIYTIKDITKLLKISRTTVMNLLETKKLRSVRAGTRWIIPEDALKDFLKGGS